MNRMLLSHNYKLDASWVNRVPPMSRADFAAIFAQGFAQRSEPIAASYIESGHWWVDVRFDSDALSPAQVGQICADLLQAARRDRGEPGDEYDLLVLGGCKLTPPTSDNPQALQTGEWGTDVVEAAEAEAFLQEIRWDDLTAGKGVDRIFRIQIERGQPVDFS